MIVAKLCLGILLIFKMFEESHQQAKKGETKQSRNLGRQFMSNYGYGYYYNPITNPNPPAWFLFQPTYPLWAQYSYENLQPIYKPTEIPSIMTLPYGLSSKVPSSQTTTTESVNVTSTSATTTSTQTTLPTTVPLTTVFTTVSTSTQSNATSQAPSISNTTIVITTTLVTSPLTTLSLNTTIPTTTSTIASSSSSITTSSQTTGTPTTSTTTTSSTILTTTSDTTSSSTSYPTTSNTTTIATSSSTTSSATTSSSTTSSATTSSATTSSSTTSSATTSSATTSSATTSSPTTIATITSTSFSSATSAIQINTTSADIIANSTGATTLTPSTYISSTSSNIITNPYIPVINNISTSMPENLIYGVSFNCTGKPTGFYRDTNYCDIFHVCLANIQMKTYPCPQVGERFYFDQVSKRCEFSSRNASGCPANNYYQQMSTLIPQTTQAVNDVSNAWKVFARENDNFTCENKIDGFYASRWCNVFYRCFLGKQFEFLCAKQTNGDRTWWSQHSSTQELPVLSAYCEYPCALKKECTAPGGVLLDNLNPVNESLSEPKRIIDSCVSDNSTSGTNNPGEDIFTVPSVINECDGAANGALVSDTNYCNIFHVCIHGKRNDFRCAKASINSYDLWWNNNTQRCDWPCNVQCDKEIFNDVKNATQIAVLDKNNCISSQHTTISNGYPRKLY